MKKNLEFAEKSRKKGKKYGSNSECHFQMALPKAVLGLVLEYATTKN